MESPNITTDLVFTPKPTRTGEFWYNRAHSGATNLLERGLIELYGGESVVGDCVTTPSGLSAIAALLHSLVFGGVPVVMVVDIELYDETVDLFNHLGNAFSDRVTIIRTDCAIGEILLKTIEEILEQFSPQNRLPTILIFAETYSNPSGRLFAFDSIPKIHEEYRTSVSAKTFPTPSKSEAVPVFQEECNVKVGASTNEKPSNTQLNSKLLIALDNTWATVCGINPLLFGIDIVVESLTKYVSGGRAIGGAIWARAGSEDAIAAVNGAQSWCELCGLHVSPLNANIISEALSGISERVTAASRQTLEVMDELYRRYGAKIVHATHRSTDRTEDKNKLCKVPPAMFLIVTPRADGRLDKNKVKERVLARPDLLDYKTSYGGIDCRVAPKIYRTPITENKDAVRVSMGTNKINIDVLAELLWSIVQ